MVQSSPNLGDKLNYWMVWPYLSLSFIFHVSDFSIIFTILYGLCLSDHAPILANVKTKGTIRRGPYRVNSSHLHGLALQDKLVALWEEIHSTISHDGAKFFKHFFKGLYEGKRITRSYGKEKARQRSKKECLLKSKLAQAQLALELDP